MRRKARAAATPQIGDTPLSDNLYERGESLSAWLRRANFPGVEKYPTKAVELMRDAADRIEELEAQLARYTELEAAARRLRDNNSGWPCEWCGWDEDTGHDEDCLAAALDAVADRQPKES